MSEFGLGSGCGSGDGGGGGGGSGGGIGGGSAGVATHTTAAAAAAATTTAASAEPRSWGELCSSYRSSWGSASLSTVQRAAEEGVAVPQRFARTAAGMCPLAEARHPLFATGEAPHVPSEGPARCCLMRSKGRGGRKGGKGAGRSL